MTNPKLYSNRLATLDDASAIAPLWQAFASERAEQDPSMMVTPDFDFTKYVAHLLEKPLSYGWLLEHSESEQSSTKKIVGCMFVYFYDEAPPVNIPTELLTEHKLYNLFVPRRVGSVLGLYVQPEHRHDYAIALIANAGIQQAEEKQVSDIDILVSSDQTGVHALLERAGFTQAAIQYTKHYTLAANANLPSLHPPHPDLPSFEGTEAQPIALPLKDFKTNELVRDRNGEVVFLMPIKDESGKILTTSNGLPIYPLAIRDPQTEDWVFDSSGKILSCPVLREKDGQMVEQDGMPQYIQPKYHSVKGKLQLLQDSENNYVFQKVERDREGNILRSPTGQIIFD
jgi:ribosomal protein S18 acetylase RimI-like enzyme